MLSNLRLATLVFIVSILPVSIFAEDGNFVLVADTPKTLTDAELRLGGHVFLRIEIADGPSHGTLLPDPSTESDWIYTPDAGFFGRDTVTYHIGNETFRVGLHVLPKEAPVAGRWSTPDCRPMSGGRPDDCAFSTAYGHGAELGWYNVLDKVFYLCDWRETFVDFCLSLPVPEPETLHHRLPFVLDEDGDGWHELALRDPISGETRVYRIVPDYEQGRPKALEEQDRWILGEAGDLPLAGNWIGGTPTEIGTYRFDDLSQQVSGYLLLESNEEFVVTTLGSVDRPWPLAGDWQGLGFDQVGLFDFDASGLWLMTSKGGPIHFESAAPRSPITTPSSGAVPVAGAGGYFQDHGIFALFDSNKTGRRFFPYSLGTAGGGSGGDGPLPVEVEVDPSGNIPPVD